MSFYTSLTGLNAATSQLAVTSNNIANVGTTGFKRSRADFGDIFATSPLQKASSVIGQGVALKQVSQEFSQGNIAFSANSLDIAITGDGFFPLKSADGLQDIFTRNGTFLLNDSYNVVNSAGQALIAAAVDSSGKADLDNLSKLLIPRKTSGDAVATSAIQLGLNFPADAQVPTLPFDKNDASTYNKTTAVTVYDAGGNGYLATVYYRKTQVATPTDATNKWQTYVYIGDTKLQEMLIQSNDKNGEKQYVNKYGEIRAEGDIPPQDIARGVTKLFNLDDLKNPVASAAASVSGDALPVTLTGEWKNSIAFPAKVTSLLEEGNANEITYSPNADSSEYTFTDGSSTYTAATLTALQSLISADDASHDYTAAMSGNDLVITANDEDLNIKPPVITADTDGKVYTFAPVTGTTDYSFTLPAGGTPITGATLTLLAANINLVGSNNYTASTSNGNLVITANAGETLTTPALTSTTGAADPVDVEADSTPELTPATVANGAITFDLNIDESSAPITIDLSYLRTLSTEKKFTGIEMAREISNVINKAYGDERYFDFSSLAATATPTRADLFTINMDNTGDRTISLTEGTDVDSLSTLTIDQAVEAIQEKVDGFYPLAADKVTVGYDAVKQSFTFKSTGEKDITLKSATLVNNELFGLTSTAVTIDQAKGTYGTTVLPNGAAILDPADQRYGVTVAFDETNNIFTISSGTTGDTSSIQIANATSLANSLFGFKTTDDGVEASTSSTPLRGIESSPAVLSSNAIGINLDNKFRVDASNNQFVVTVDNVTGLIEMPPKGDYNIEEFRDELEKRINSLADSFGRSVNGVKVEIADIPGTNNKQFKFTTGTTGDSSFLKVSANSIWGLANVESARGSTSRWLEPPQAKNADGFPLYVDRDGLETSDPGTFSEDETRELWSPIFLDKGELTFDTGGNLKSPVTATEFKSTTIGNSGATLQFSIDYGASTQFSSPFSVLKQDQNGRPEGDLIGVDIADDGLVSASYSNGSQKSLAKIVLVNFASPTGLRQIGDSSYYATSKSGDAKYGEAGAAGFGTVRAGARERANVDLTTELVELITAQRNFQANAKAIETNNTLTQAIINIRS